MAVRILENYMKENAAAVLSVVESVEKLRKEGAGILSPEEAAAISVAMYGAPPKPPASNVACILSAKRLWVEDKSMADDVVMSMSVARYGIESNSRRAESAAEKIARIMDDITNDLKPYIDSPDRVFVGLNDDSTPRVDCTKYTLVNPDKKKITLESFKMSNVTERVEKSLNEILSEVHQQKIDHQDASTSNFINVIMHHAIVKFVISWANNVEFALKEHEQATRPISSHVLKVKSAVKDIMNLVGNSYCSTATQLTSLPEISRFERAANICYTALMAETYERIVSDLLFYINFKIIRVDDKEYVKNSLGTMAGTVKKPLCIERRDAAETLFGLCFMLKMMPPQFVDIIMTLPWMDLQNSNCHYKGLPVLLRNYGPRFDDSWARFKDVLSERNRVVKELCDKGGRIDQVDAIANLVGLVYVLVVDAANAFQEQRTCSYKFLNEIKDKFRLWNKFVRAQ